MLPEEPIAVQPSGEAIHSSVPGDIVVVDIVIPVYNEGPNILKVLQALEEAVRSPARVLICYDRDDDDTLNTIASHWPGGRLPIEFVRNQGKGAHGAVMTGLRNGAAPYVIVYPGDDDYNAGIVDRMVAKACEGNDVVCASRFMSGGSMVRCPWLKAFLVRAAARSLFHLAHVPTHDATNGFRLFSRRVIEQIKVESSKGFTYSLELLVKVQRLRWNVAEVPARWFERSAGRSRFRVLRWIPAYLAWYFYAFGTAYFRRLPASVPLREEPL